MSHCYDQYSPVDRTFSGVQVFLTEYGTKQHLEFAEFHDVDGAVRGLIDDGKRGVFGYVSFGMVYLGNFVQWYEPQFINWGVNFYEPPNEFCDVFRVWNRFGLHGKIWWATQPKRNVAAVIIGLQNTLLP